MTPELKPTTEPTSDSIEALRNPRTDKLFIVLEYDAQPGKIKVINPEGNILDVAEVIFDLDPVFVQSSQFAQSFADKQLDEYKKYQQQQTELARNVERLKKVPKAFTGEVKAPTRRSSSGSSKSSSKVARRVEWESDGLVFYRHHIEPMRDHDSMVIRVLDVGTFELTKAEFLRSFNYVVMSPDYRQTGVVKIPGIPEEAKKFLKA